MKTFITDSKYLSKVNQFIFANKLFDYRIKEIEGGKEITPQIYHRVFGDKLEGIICPSNYPLIYDILSIDPEAKFYNSFNFKWGDKPLQINKKRNSEEMINSIKRSYISFLIAKDLASLGLKRIEQYIIISVISLLKNRKNFTVETIEKLEEKKLETIDSMNFLHYVAKKEKITIKEALKKMLQEYGKGNSTSPFVTLELKEKHSYYKYYNELLQSKEKIKVYLVNGKEIVQSSEDKNMVTYLMGEETVFKKQIIVRDTKPSLPLVFRYTKDIMPYRDMLLTITLLFQMKILNDDLSLNLEEEKLQINSNLDWLDKNLWQEVYSNLDFDFGYIFSSLNIKEKGFRCPICDSRSYYISSLQVHCSNCKFAINRYLPQHFQMEKFSIEEVISLLNNKTILKKNKIDKSLTIGLKSLNKNIYSLEVLNF